MVSLNAGTRSTYEWLMGADRYNLVSDNIRNFLEMREKSGSKPKVVIQILETKKTKPEVKEFKESWSSLIGPNDSIYVRPLLNWGGKIDYNVLCVREKGKRYPCYSLWAVIAIDKNGNVYPCCDGFSSRKESDLLFGNVQEKPLIGIYSEKIKEVRKMHLNSRWNDISVCSKCDLWSFSQNSWFNFRKRWF